MTSFLALLSTPRVYCQLAAHMHKTTKASAMKDLNKDQGSFVFASEDMD
jgi:hypothetical protein